MLVKYFFITKPDEAGTNRQKTATGLYIPLAAACTGIETGQQNDFFADLHNK